MKDPLTLAFDIRWLGLAIWHRDKGGIDGACGWTYPHLTKQQLQGIKDFAWCEARDRYFLRCPGKRFNGSRSDAELLYRALFIRTARTIGVPVTLEYATLEAILRVHKGDYGGDNVFCWLPGYHTNFYEDTQEERELHFRRVLANIAKEILADHRPWWRHPRWHIHHWQLQWAPLQWFNLRFIMRCKYCGGRFKLKEYPISDWNGTTHWHEACSGKRAAAAGGVSQQDQPWPRS